MAKGAGRARVELVVLAAQVGEVVVLVFGPEHTALRADAVLDIVRLGVGEPEELIQLARGTVALERRDVLALAQEIDHRLRRLDSPRDRRDRLGGEVERGHKLAEDERAKLLGADHARQALRRLERALLEAKRVLRVLEHVDVADGALLNCRGGGRQGACGRGTVVADVRAELTEPIAVHGRQADRRL